MKLVEQAEVLEAAWSMMARQLASRVGKVAAILIAVAQCLLGAVFILLFIINPRDNWPKGSSINN